MFNKKNIFKIAIVLMVLIFAISIGFNVKTEIENWKDRIKQEGVEAGRIEGASQVWNMLSYQFTTTGRLELPSNNSQGTTTIIFLPQQ